jgi:HK97 family phage prohead protease
MNPELRAEKATDGAKIIKGYFAVFDSEYDMGYGITESVDPGAFNNTLAGDVRALWNHNTDIVLGRTGVKTLTLGVDTHGLYGQIDINENDSDAVNAHARVERGDVSQCSFGFDIIREEYEERPDGSWHFRLMEVELYEVSPCTFPAYKETAISARADEVKIFQKRETDIWKAKMKERIKKTC